MTRLAPVRLVPYSSHKIKIAFLCILSYNQKAIQSIFYLLPLSTLPFSAVSGIRSRQVQVFTIHRTYFSPFYNKFKHIIVIYIRFLYKGIIIKHNKTEPTYTKTSLFLCEKRRFFMARTEKGVVTTI